MIEIKPIEEHQIEQAKQVVTKVCLEIWQGLSVEDLRSMDSMFDIDRIKSHYLARRGVFLVLVDQEKVVGTEAIRQLDYDTCELKRMWFLKAYRGQGFGRQMVNLLFNFAKQQKYQRVRLDLVSKEKQLKAVKFYQKLGFYPIERYNDSICTVFMETLLLP